MKRIFSLLLCLLIVLSTIFASGCGTEDDGTDTSDTVSSLSDGFEYLDSLGGSCNVTNEGSYRKEMVMMLAGEGGKA